MATTTNFGWETPDDTDLVKDGAAAIRTALGGVDTSFVDLKGGTTGEVLSKASNTDLDFTWKTAEEQYPWQAYTSSPVGITVGNGTLTTRYQQIGKTINLEIVFILGSTSAVTGTPIFALPVNAKLGNYSVLGTTVLGDLGVTNYFALAVTPFGNYLQISLVNTTGTYASESATVNATTPMTWVTGDSINIRATYEAA